MDAKACGVAKESDAGSDALRVEVGLGMEREFVAEPHQRGEQADLPGGAADLGIIVERDPRQCWRELGGSAFGFARHQAPLPTIVMAELDPAIDVFGSAPGARRGCPGQARA